MQKKCLFAGLCIVALLFIVGCAKGVSEEQLLEDLEELSDEEIDAAIAEPPLAGEAYQATPYQILPQRQSLVQNVSKNVKSAGLTFTSCTDSDGGQKYSVAGEVVQEYSLKSKITSRAYSDSCRDDWNLTEYYCDGNHFRRATNTCEFGCTEDACAKFFEYIPEAPPESNRALDVIVYVDTDGDWKFTDGTSNLTESDVRPVLNLADELFYEKTGIHLIVRDIRFLSFQSIESLGSWVVSLVGTEPEPPEALVIFTQIGDNWLYGGLSGYYAIGDDFPYCNEFELRGRGDRQRRVGVATVDWKHYYAACGYDHETPPGRTRISETPTLAECRDNQSDQCVLREDRAYYQCQSTLNHRYSDLDFFTASSVVHEIAHTLDNEELGHFGSTICGVMMEEDFESSEEFILESQRNLGMCPRTFENIPTHFKGCS